MKKSLLLISAILFIPFLIMAQQEKANVVKKKGNLSLDGVHSSLARQHLTNPVTNAIFDVQFNLNLGVTGCAGVVWTGTKFWVAKWASDTLFGVDTLGALIDTFVISGVTGIRGMTTDGTFIYAGINSTVIQKIDIATKAVVGTITAPFATRGIAYDSTANSGAGGLWISNFTSDIDLISLSGGVLNTLAAVTHGLTGMYSIAFDPYTAGGPYIWAHDQGAAGALDNVVRIPIATGVPDLTHDVTSDISGTTAGIAGGLCITWGLRPGVRSIVGVCQAGPNVLFAYELNDYSLPAIDASADTVNFTPPYTFFPDFLAVPMTFSLSARNRGTSSLDTIAARIVVNDGATDVFVDSGYVTAIGAGSQATIPFAGTYTATAQSAFTVSSIVNTRQQADLVSINDSTGSFFIVTDTVMGRDDANPTGSIGIGNGSGGSIGQVFEIPTLSYASSGQFLLNAPVLGDSCVLELWDYAFGTPNNLIATSATYVFVAADTAGAALVLPFLNGPIAMPTGTYLLAVREYSSNVTLATTPFNFHLNSTWVNAFGTGWATSESYGFNITLLLRLDVYSQAMVSVSEMSKDVFSLYPSPAQNQFWLDLPAAGDYTVTVSDVQGKAVYFSNLKGESRQAITTDKWANGVYIVKVSSAGKNYYGKAVITK